MPDKAITEETRRLFTDRFNELLTGRTQEDFAKITGLARPTVGLYASGKRIADTETLLKIARSCKVSTDWLLGLSDVDEVDEVAQAAAARYGLSNSSLKALENLIYLQHKKGVGQGIDYYAALNALLPTMQFIDLLQAMDLAKDCREYAKEETGRRQRETEAFDKSIVEAHAKAKEVQEMSLEDQRAWREQEKEKARNAREQSKGRTYTSSDSELIQAMAVVIQHRGVPLDATKAVHYHAQDASRLLQEVVTAYCESRAKSLDVFKRDGDPNA